MAFSWPAPGLEGLSSSCHSSGILSDPSKFVKKIDEIPSLELSPSDPFQKALTS